MDRATVPGNSSSSLSFIKFTTSQQPTASKEQWIHWSSCRHFEEVDGKVHQRWETMELWTDTVPCDINFQHHPITTWSPHREKTEDFTSTDPLINWKNCGKFQDLRGTHQETAEYFHQQLQHGTWTRTACFCQGSTWKHLEDRNNRSACHRTRFLLGKVSRWFHPEKDPPDDQTQVTTFSFQVGDLEQREEHTGIQDLQKWAVSRQCSQRWNSQPYRQAIWFDSIPWDRNIIQEAGLCY